MGTTPGTKGDPQHLPKTAQIELSSLQSSSIQSNAFKGKPSHVNSTQFNSIQLTAFPVSPAQFYIHVLACSPSGLCYHNDRRGQLRLLCSLWDLPWLIPPLVTRLRLSSFLPSLARSRLNEWQGLLFNKLNLLRLNGENFRVFLPQAQSTQICTRAFTADA